MSSLFKKSEIFSGYFSILEDLYEIFMYIPYKRVNRAKIIKIPSEATINLIIFSDMQKFETHTITINKTQNKKRLDQTLTYHLKKYSRSHIKILLLNENVKKTDKIITDASYKVKEGEIFTISIPKIIPSSYDPEDIPLNIIFEDNDIIVVNKPSGMVTHPAPGNEQHTLVNALLHHTNNHLSFVNGNNRPGIIHRLDKDTSGLIVIAKNNNTYFNLSNQFRNHSIIRKYYAVVWGTPQNQTIKGYIKRDKINRKKMAFNKIDEGKYSETLINLIKNYGICSLIECTLKTGRTHQVRLHLSNINYPLVGDKVYGTNKITKYGKDKKNFKNYLFLRNFQRQALHAYILGFVHPTTKKYVEFKSELPEDMLKLLEFVVKY